jgi:hypothetical protein
MVKPSQLIDSENLTTLFVIVSKFGLQEWEATYEKLSNFVVGLKKVQAGATTNKPGGSPEKAQLPVLG